MMLSITYPRSLVQFPPGSDVVFVRTCLPGDTRWLGKRGKVLRTLASGGVVVRFGPFWKRRVETCFPEELALL